MLLCPSLYPRVCSQSGGAPALRPGAIAQSPGREAALAWASLAQRFPASSVLAREGAGCERRAWRLAGLSSALAFPLDLGARPLCTPLGLAQRKRASPRGEAGTSGFLSVSQSLGQEDPLEKEMVTHSSILAWRIPWTEEPGGLRSLQSQSAKRPGS